MVAPPPDRGFRWHPDLDLKSCLEGVRGVPGLVSLQLPIISFSPGISENTQIPRLLGFIKDRFRGRFTRYCREGTYTPFVVLCLYTLPCLPAYMFDKHIVCLDVGGERCLAAIR